LSKTAAARRAGYRGKESTLRGTASRAAQSSKVKALLHWAKQGGAGPSEVAGSLEDLEKILWRHARGDDAQRSIAATQALHRMKCEQREREGTGADVDLKDILNEIANKKSPLLALWLARNDGIWCTLSPMFRPKACVGSYQPKYSCRSKTSAGALI
jgi:hypothetical protein